MLLLLVPSRSGLGGFKNKAHDIRGEGNRERRDKMGKRVRARKQEQGECLGFLRGSLAGLELTISYAGRPVSASPAL